MANELPTLRLADDAAWEAWLERHHVDSPGAWLALARKGARAATPTHAQALDTALCFGWIDGQVRRLDEHYTLRRFTPRRPRSRWSQINCGHAERLIADGRMRPAGLAQVTAARADGRWDRAYAPASTITIPDDLARALEAEPRAQAFFATLTGDARYAYLYRLHHVTDPIRRAARIADYVTRLRERRTLD